MIQLVRRPVLLLCVVGLVAACGSTDSPTPPTAPPTAAARATASPTAALTTAPPTTPPAVQAPVTGTFTATRCCPMTLTVTASDPRVSGTGEFDLQSQESEDGSMAWEWGNIGLSNDGGSWDGSCRGGGWDNAGRAEVSCWLTGQGAYGGLTYFEHLSANRGQEGHFYGMILPLPAPTS